MKVLNTYLVKYNFLISVCSVFLLIYFSLLTHLYIHPNYYLFTFFGTLCIYNLYRLFPASLSKIRSQFSSFAIELIVYSLVLCIILFCLMISANKYLYILPVVLSLMYKYPIISKKDLRSLPFVKVFVIAIVWIGMAVIPLFSGRIDEQTENKIIFLSITQFLFFLAITIPFDVFDVEKDDMKTTATALGPKKAMLISITCLMAYFVLHLIEHSNFKEKLAHSIVTIIATVILVQYRKLRTKELQYYFIDGLIIVQTLIIYLLD